MAQQAIVQRRFDGGTSQDPQVGPANSHAYSRGLDFRKQPSQLTVLPRTVQEGKGVITDLIQQTVMDLAGNIYALGDAGGFYKRDTSGVWTRLATLDDGAFGMSYRSDVDKLFIVSSTAISEYAPLTGSPTISANKYGESVSTDTGAVLSGGALTYTLPTSITEAEMHRQDFTSDIEPISKIRVKVQDNGTGNWTLTLHDATHVTLATATVLNASITDGQNLDFEFTTPPRIYVKPNARTYHFHLTSTVADGKVYCATASDLNTCDFSIYADRLIDTRNGMHPMQTFLQYECIGNGNYLSVWEPLSDEPGNLEFLRHRLRFPAGLEVCGLARYQEFLAIACEQATTSGDAQEGAIYFWDGLSSTYNHWIPVPEGSPYGLHESRDTLRYIAGGSLYAYTGGSPYKLRTLPGTDTEYSDATDTTVTYPYMSTVRRGVTLVGFPSSTTDTDMEHGVYAHGAANKDYPESFGLNHTISTGTRTGGVETLRLGHVKSYGDTLFVSWQDGSSYGLDRINNSSDPYETSVFESLWFDNNIPFKDKSGSSLIVTFTSLPVGASLVLKYRTARDGAWTSSEVFTSANTPDDRAKLTVSGRWQEIQTGFELTVTGTESPVITSRTLVFNDLTEEAFN